MWVGKYTKWGALREPARIRMTWGCRGGTAAPDPACKDSEVPTWVLWFLPEQGHHIPTDYHPLNMSPQTAPTVRGNHLYEQQTNKTDVNPQ